jgi:outer membrane immunogenic protein
MNKIVFAPLAALLFVVPAHAADFAGPRVELRAGWDKIGVDVDYDDGSDTLSGSGSADDFGYGAEAGYDFSVGGKGILGAYAGIDFSGNKVCTEVYGEDEACLKAGRNFTVGVRSGLTVGSNALVYVKGGYSNGKVTLRYDDFEDILEDFKLSETRDGFHVGAGAELAFGKNAYGKLEYVYTSYNGYDYDDGTSAAGIDSDRHQILAGIGLRF